MLHCTLLYRIWLVVNQRGGEGEPNCDDKENGSWLGAYGSKIVLLRIKHSRNQKYLV